VAWTARDRTPGYSIDLLLRPPAGSPARSDNSTRSGNPTPSGNTTLPTSATPAPLQVGFGRATINPDLSDARRPVWLAGFEHGRRATAIHDDLWAVAAVIDDGTHRLAVVALDAIGMFYDDVVAIRRRMPARDRLDYVIVASTHNHSTPDLMGLWGKNSYTSGVDPAYRETAIAGAVAALQAAVDAVRPAQAAMTEIPMSPAGLVADSREPQVFDPNLRLMHFTQPDSGTTIGSIVGWADHPETPWAANTEVTADFPGYLREALEHGVTVDGRLVQAGLGGIHLYVNGAIGGLMTTNPDTVVTDPFLGQAFREPSHGKARAVGRRLAEAVLHAAHAGTPAELRPQWTIRAKTIELPFDNILFRLAPVIGILDRGQPHWKRIKSEIAVLRFGRASIACVPGEIYPEIVNGGIIRPPGADFIDAPAEAPPLRDLMPGEVKFIFGLANDEVGYIIPKSEWDNEPPWLFNGAARQYGEINSLGPDTAAGIHGALKQALEDIH
jgi:hypothetical protein